MLILAGTVIDGQIKAFDAVWYSKKLAGLDGRLVLVRPSKKHPNEKVKVYDAAGGKICTAKRAAEKAKEAFLPPGVRGRLEKRRRMQVSQRLARDSLSYLRDDAFCRIAG